MLASGLLNFERNYKRSTKSRYQIGLSGMEKKWLSRSSKATRMLALRTLLASKLSWRGQIREA
jgi:hypothetical protein